MAVDTVVFLIVFFAIWALGFLVNLVVAVVWLVRWVRRARMVAALKRTGHRVIAQVTNISREFVFSPMNYVSFRFSWYVMAEWTDPKTGIPYHFKSGPLHRRQAKLYAIGELIGVLVDPADPNRYYVEPAH